MKLETSEPQPGEPEGGWVTAPALLDTVITSLVLCRFSGIPRGSLSETCPARQAGRHKDVDCTSIYYQAEALAAGQVDQARFSSTQAVTRSHGAGDDPIGTSA